MKKLVTLIAVLPVSAMAHGGHAPVPEVAHGLAHVGPIAGAAVFVGALGLAIVQRWRS